MSMEGGGTPPPTAAATCVALAEPEPGKRLIESRCGRVLAL